MNRLMKKTWSALVAVVLFSSCYSLSNRSHKVVQANCDCKTVESTYDDSTMTFILGGCKAKDMEAEAQRLMDTLANQVPAVCKSKRILVFRFVQPDTAAVDVRYFQCEPKPDKISFQF